MFLTINLVYSCPTEFFEIELIIYIKMDLALKNLQMLICHKNNQPTNQPTILTLIHIFPNSEHSLFINSISLCVYIYI